MTPRQSLWWAECVVQVVRLWWKMRYQTFEMNFDLKPLELAPARPA